MTIDQVVLTATVAVVAVAIGLVVAGVAVLAGLGWALITGGVFVGPTALGVGAVLLRDLRSP